MSVARCHERRYATPAQVAADLGVNQSKILAWIHRGELRAVNVATRVGGRPRWRIDVADLHAFLDRRSATPPPKPTRRRRQRDEGVIHYF